MERHPGASRANRHVGAPPLTRLLAALLTGLVLGLLAAAPVMAHAELEQSIPEDGAVLGTPPTLVTLAFTEALDASRSSFRIVKDGMDVATGGASAGGETTMAATGLSLEPGDYVIEWTAVADDGHVERGRLTFTVTEPTPPPATAGASEIASTAASASGSLAPQATPSSAPSPSAQTTPAGSSGSDVLLPIVAALVAVGVVAYLVLRRSRPA